MLRAAHDRLKASFGDSGEGRARRCDPALDGRRGRSPRSRRDTLDGAERGAARARPTTSPCIRSSRASSSGAATAIDEGGIDWGHAEALAYASLLVDGIPVRLTGQDVAARHVRAAASRPARRAHRRDVHADAASRRCDRRRSRSTTRRSPSTRAWASSTATRPPRPRRSSSGRRSTATSQTARRS